MLQCFQQNLQPRVADCFFQRILIRKVAVQTGRFYAETGRNGSQGKSVCSTLFHQRGRYFQNVARREQLGVGHY